MTDWDKFQKEGIQWLKEHHRGLLADSVGSGKSRQAILATNDFYGPVLIVSTGLSCDITWPTQCQTWGNSDTILRVASGDSVPTALVHRYNIITYSLFKDVIYEIDTWKPRAVILDEVHKLPLRKSLSYKRISNYLNSVRMRDTPVFMLSASPVKNHLQELWRFYHLIDPKKFNSFYGWCNSRLEQKTLRLGQKIVKQTTDDIQFGMESKFKEEYNSMILERTPPKLYDKAIVEVVRLPMTPKQHAMYNQFVNDGWFEVAPEVFIYNKSMLSQLMKTVRIGITPVLEGVSIQSSKIEWVQDFFDGTKEQIVVFSQFPDALRELQSNLPVGSMDLITGDTRDRAGVAKRFMAGEFQVLGLSTMVAESIPLYNAHLMIGLDVTWDPEQLLQVIGRCTRPEQKNQVRVWLLSNNNTDEYMLSNVKTKALRTAELRGKEYALF